MIPAHYQKELRHSLLTGLIDKNHPSIEDLRPRLLVNDPTMKVKVLSSVLSELRKCEEFIFSVAFITNSGVASIIQTLKELPKDVKGKILTSQYLNFTEPRALERLIHLQKSRDLDIRIRTNDNFHAKGYLFKHEDQMTVIVGSSNLTGNALCVNNEWNLKLTSAHNGALVHEMAEQFDKQFLTAEIVNAQWIEQYKEQYDETLSKLMRAEEGEKASVYFHAPLPNKMQVEALASLSKIREDGENKALVVSATGTGKTYLSAFDIQNFKPKRMLFVIHREQIARAAMRSFQNVFGSSVKMGIYSGSEREDEADYIFSTVQTISRPEHYQKFSPDHFDYIIIDEAHHAAASSYQNILNYFKPQFLLGITATPERTDDGNVFGYFDHNLAYEIRLHAALRENMLVPFHYYGVSDIYVDGQVIDESANFNNLVSKERVKHIIQYTRFYGCDHGRIRGLMFCSSVDETKRLSEELNKKGLRTKALTGESSEKEREDALRRLESDGSDALDYILTRDIFNEGIDIRSVNQIVMLRPTQSAIVFVQQLGRGLRLYPGKEYLTVIDFIGNYQNNFLVPIALYGDRSYNKDTIRRLVATESLFIPGASTIDFDVITRERIFKAIDQASVNRMSDLKKDYDILKNQLGRIPQIMDFVEHGSRDPFTFVLNKTCRTYYGFLQKVEKENVPSLPNSLANMLWFVSLEIANGKRGLELHLLKEMIEKGRISISELHEVIKTSLKNPKGLPITEEDIASALRVINGEFFKADDMKKYETHLIVQRKEDVFRPTEHLLSILENAYFKTQLLDILEFGLHRFYESCDVDKYRDGFVLYEKYSRKDVCRILNWEKDESSTVYGYRIKNNRTCPIFVTLKKDDSISKSTMYEDYFIDPKHFHWMTRNNVRKNSTEAVQIRAAKESKLRICLFVKKSDDESSDFYFLGDALPFGEDIETTILNDKGEKLPIVNFNFELEDSVPDYLYTYFHK